MELVQEKQESNPPLPVLPRLDRLDSLLRLLEEKYNFSPKPLSRNMEPQEQNITLSNALDEVHHKGTLLDRLEMLEKRVLQLSLVMDEQNTSRSSSSTVPASEKFGHSSGLSSVTKEDQDETSNLEGRPDPVLGQEETSAQGSVTSPVNHHNSRKERRKYGRKYRGWCRFGC